MPVNQPKIIQEPRESIDIEKFIRENYGWMLALAESMLGERGTAEDTVQEALIKALNALPNFEHRSSVKTWLRRITVNQTITTMRKLKRLSEVTLDEHQPEFDNFDCRIEEKWDSFPTPEQLLEQKHTRQLIEKALKSLPQSYSIVVRLRDVEGYNTSEVADLLGVSESNVKVRLHRARSALKKILEPVLRREGAES